MCCFSSGNWFFYTKFVHLAVAGKRLVKGTTQLCTSKKECNKLDLTGLSISNWSITMIGSGGLLLVVPTNMQFPLQFYWWGCQKKTAKLRDLI